MARDVNSLWSPLVENGHQGDYAKNKFIVHSTGDRGSALAIYNYFNRPNIVVESTFVVGLGPEDPTRQLMDSSQLADANIAANATGISVEVVGTGDDDYTPWQVSELVRLGTWAHANHGIPHQIIPEPNGAGYGWHVMFGSPGPWTSVKKVCPGDKRIGRLTKDIFPAIFGGVPVPVKPAPSAGKPPALGWTLPVGYYYGNEAGPRQSIGANYDARTKRFSPRADVKVIQQWLIFRGCVARVPASAWQSSTWADGRWQDATDVAMAEWHRRFYPGQPYPKQCWSDDLARLTA